MLAARADIAVTRATVAASDGVTAVIVSFAVSVSAARSAEVPVTSAMLVAPELVAASKVAAFAAVVGPVTVMLVAALRLAALEVPTAVPTSLML